MVGGRRKALANLRFWGVANMTGEGKWAEAFGMAREMVGKMTLEDKVCLLFRFLFGL